MAPSIPRKTFYWTIAGVVVAIIGIVLATLLPSPGGRDSTQTQSGSGNQQAQNGGINAGRDVNIQSQEFQREAAGLSRAEAEREAAKYQGITPPAGVPAPFLVLAPRHLWVRSSAAVDGYHIGAAFDQVIVWVDCSSVSGFDPDVSDEVEAKWLRVRWPTDRRNEDLWSSQPSDKYVGWIYAGLVLPSGHNGQVPPCVTK
ncbi:hypothetical protein [Actinoplanes derwentensis]|uniref:SH3 domain-containing protein n=1 Tax=Actinoplanes derwentensis TaxID=113562 RepID=A0A1H1SNU0_9ACTN|nr:hypothetical protein [Actinoplanes derwentensis]SDS49571.1 hypothetical protein SAMN04489716_0911 [Actinoplanes derwentensis]